MTSAVLYGTTSDNELRPVRVTDSGEFVTDGGGGGDWYANLYVGGTEGDSSISLLSDGSISANGNISSINGYVSGGSSSSQYGLLGQASNTVGSTAAVYARQYEANGLTFIGADPDGLASFKAYANGTINATGDVYANKFIDSDGYDLGKIGQALSTIHDVIESVDDLQGLKNLFHLLLDNLKSDPKPSPE